MRTAQHEPDPTPRMPRSLATPRSTGQDKCLTHGCLNLAGIGPFCASCAVLAEHYDRLEILGTLVSFPPADPEPSAPAALPPSPETPVEAPPEETELPAAALSIAPAENTGRSFDFCLLDRPSEPKPRAKSRFEALPNRIDCGIARRRTGLRRLLDTVAAAFCLLPAKKLGGAS